MLWAESRRVGCGHIAALGSGSVHPGNRHLPASKILSCNGLNSRIVRDVSQLSLALIRSLANVWNLRVAVPWVRNYGT